MVLPLSNLVSIPTLSRRDLEAQAQAVGAASEQGLVDSRISVTSLVVADKEDLQEIFSSSCLVRTQEGRVLEQTSTYEGPTLKPRSTSPSWKPQRERPRQSLFSPSPTAVLALGPG